MGAEKGGLGSYYVDETLSPHLPPLWLACSQLLQLGIKLTELVCHPWAGQSMKSKATGVWPAAQATRQPASQDYPPTHAPLEQDSSPTPQT